MIDDIDEEWRQGFEDMGSDPDTNNVEFAFLAQTEVVLDTVQERKPRSPGSGAHLSAQNTPPTRRYGSVRIEIECSEMVDGTSTYEVTAWRWDPSVLEDEPDPTLKFSTLDEGLAAIRAAWINTPSVTMDDAWHELAASLMVRGASLSEMVDSLRELKAKRQDAGLPSKRTKTIDEIFDEFRDHLGMEDEALDDMLALLRKIREGMPTNES